MLNLTRRLRPESTPEGLLVLDVPEGLPAGTRLRLWVRDSPRGRGRVLVTLDVPPAVLVRRGELESDLIPDGVKPWPT